MEYNFQAIEKKWQQTWADKKTFATLDDCEKPKYYVLDMFPYPSGAGLHVGHPLGYIASDIVARYKKLKGFNVLHPMGFDSFGLPAEQYAIQTGKHPATTTKQNIETFKKQMAKISFCYDWSREVQTSDPQFYKWTQYIFLKIFNAWFDRREKKAKEISTLIEVFNQEGSINVSWMLSPSEHFSSQQWQQKTEQEQASILMKYRLAFQEDAVVNWCEGLGTVLANDEVVNGVSERGGHPVERKKMKQWFLRITEYADRLLEGLEQVDFSDAMKEMQRNWIGKSSGAEMQFSLVKEEQILSQFLDVYTTRPDTVFGIDFIVIAPEHSLVHHLTTQQQKESVEQYLHYVKSRSEVARMSETKQVTGCFTGSYALHPFTQQKIPIWIGEYVLIGYGTGAVIAVPCGDDRDYLFAQHFQLPITNIWGTLYDGTKAYCEKFGQLCNSDFLNGVEAKDAMEIVIKKLEDMKIGKRKINFRMRDAGFSRQRYWGEPFPILHRKGIAKAINENELPLLLPDMQNFKSVGKQGKGPLSLLTDWVNVSADTERETDTMPGYAGSSWYFLRYMDPHNQNTFCDSKKSTYWNQVDLYVGGTEHAVGHLLYSRLWTKILFDLGYISFQEPYKKLLNQGKITGVSKLIYRVRGEQKFVSLGLKNNYTTDPIYVDVNFVNGDELNIQELQKAYPDFANATFVLDDEKFICHSVVEKMSKSKLNTVNPDQVIDKYGADTFRLYEMFLGPIQQSKPWDTKGIEGTQRFLKKTWRLFFDETSGKKLVTQKQSSIEAQKAIHKLIKKIEEDLDRYTFNTSVSSFMIAVNTLTELHCHEQDVLDILLILLSPFAPHLAEELWQQCGHTTSIFEAPFPVCNQSLLVENEKTYPIAVNGKVKTEIAISLDVTQEEIEKMMYAHPDLNKWTGNKTVTKIIYAKGRMINLVV